MNTNSICAGSIATIQASGANTYTWSNGFIGSNLILPPGSPLNYTITGANSQTCISTATVALINVPIPTLSVSGNTLICKGQSTSLLANGASTYSWSNSSTTPFTSLTPNTSTIITVMGTDALTNCFAIKSITVNVLPLPVISISGDTLICSGETTNLQATGANTYSWNTGSMGQNISISPNSSTSYTVIGTNTAGSCASSKLVMVTVSACLGIDNSNMTFTALKLYPNPSNGNVFIETPTKVQLVIYTDLGKLISEKEIEKGTHTLDLSEYSSGVYFLKISNSNFQKVLKLIKTN